MDAMRLIKTPGGNENSPEEIENILSCPICLEVFTKPVVILPCQHNLCRQCAQDMFQSRGSSLGNGGRFKCPTCRYEVLLDRHGVYGLQRNLLVENIIDMYHASQNSSTVNKIKQAKTNDEIMCTEHTEEKVNIYCVTCQKPICSLCKIFGSCVNCEVSTFKEMHSTLKSELSESINKLVTSNDQLSAAISQTEEIYKVTEMNGEGLKNKINAAFDKLKAVMEERRKFMIGIVNKDLKKKKDYSDRITRGLKSQQSISGEIMDGALNLVDVNNSAFFLEQARLVIDKIEENVEVTYDNDTCMDLKNMDRFKYNFNQEEEVISLINFLAFKVSDVPSTSKDLQPCVQYPWDTQETEDEDDSSLESEEEKEESAEEEEEVKNYQEEILSQEENKNESSSSSDESSSEEEQNSNSQKYPWRLRSFRSSGYLTTSTPVNNEAGSSSKSPEMSLPKPRASVRVKIDPPKPVTYQRPSYKPKHAVRFANLEPLLDSDDDIILSSRRKLRNRYTSSTKYSPGITLADSGLDAGASSRSNSASPNLDDSAVELNRARKRSSGRDYCTHKRRTWSHLLDKKP